MTFKVEVTKEKTAFIHKNKETCNFCGIANFIYYKHFQH